MSEKIPNIWQGFSLLGQLRSPVVPECMIPAFRYAGSAAEGIEKFVPVVVRPAGLGIGEDVRTAAVPVLPGVKEGLAAPGR
jgi:hypothetical protein